MTLTELFASTTEAEIVCAARAGGADLGFLKAAREDAREWLRVRGRINLYKQPALGTPTALESFAFPNQDEFLEAAMLGGLNLDEMFERSARARAFLLEVSGSKNCSDCVRPCTHRPYFTSASRNLRFCRS